MSDTLEKAKEIVLSLSMDEQAELGAVLQDSIFGGSVSDASKAKIASVIRARSKGPFVLIDDPETHGDERLRKIRARLAAAQPATDGHA
jgi:hypothetical protein